MFNKSKSRVKNFSVRSGSFWKTPFVLGLIVIAAYIITESFVLEGEFEFIGQIVTVLTIAIITWLSVFIINGVKDVISRNKLKNSGNKFEAQRVNTQLKILVRIMTIVFVIIGLAMVLMTFPQIRKVGISIIASAGVVGIMVGLAAQKSLSNILSGLQVAFTQPIKIGDVIRVEGETGIVEDITLSKVIVKAYDRRRLIIPINYFIEKVFQNWTVSSSDLIGRIEFELDYTTPIQKMREALDAILDQYEFWDKNVKKLEVIAVSLQTIKIRISVSASTSSDSWKLKCYVREKMIEFLQKEHPYCLPKFRLDTGSKD